jgi:hypothetical protein
VDEAVAAADLLEEAAFVAVGEEAGEVPGDFVVAGEDDAEAYIAITGLVRYDIDREHSFSLEPIDAALFIGLTPENC